MHGILSRRSVRAAGLICIKVRICPAARVSLENRHRMETTQWPKAY
jgi:hypothetical protein